MTDSLNPRDAWGSAARGSACRPGAELCPSDCADQGSVGCTEADCCAPIPQAFCGDKHGYFRYHSEEPDAMHDPNMAGMLHMFVDVGDVVGMRSSFEFAVTHADCGAGYEAGRRWPSGVSTATGFDAQSGQTSRGGFDVSGSEPAAATWLPGTDCANSPCDLGDAHDHAACCTPCDPTTHAVWSRTNSNPGEWVRTKLGQFATADGACTDLTICENSGEGGNVAVDGTADRVCVTCPAGKFATASDDDCLACPAGQTSEDGADTCAVDSSAGGTSCNFMRFMQVAAQAISHNDVNPLASDPMYAACAAAAAQMADATVRKRRAFACEQSRKL